MDVESFFPQLYICLIFTLEGDAFMVEDGTYLTYLYPDLTSSMYGKADEKGHMINGRYGRVHQYKVHKLGLPIPKVRLLFIILHLHLNVRGFYTKIQRTRTM